MKDAATVIKPKKKGQPRILNVKYEARNVLFQNIHLLMVVDEKVAIGGGAE